MSQQGFLVLESGETYSGDFRGGKDRAGEVVFNTSHSGYEEIATDPSYYGQIVVMTAPMQGNYSVSRSFWESRQMWIDGFISVEMQQSARDQGWMNQLAEARIPILSDLDTREVTLRLRELGTPWGALVQAGSSSEARDKASQLIQQKKRESQDWVWAVSRRKTEELNGEVANGPRIAVYDFGAKENILRELQSRSSKVLVVPAREAGKTIQDWQADGIMLSNGPGDPSQVVGAVESVQSLLGWKPIFGICMGHQILSMALGASTYKLKFGHRGSNHPVRDRMLNRIYVTSQNHGYAVKESSLPSSVRVSHTNLNDNTVEGIECQSKKCFSVQYHPESHPGPHEASALFDLFVSQLRTEGRA